MKSVRFSFMNRKFDDQYTFDLQGYLSVQDFCTSFNLLNQAAFDHPPPGNKLTWLIGIWIVWVIAIIGNYLLWLCTKWSYGLVIFPFFMVLSTLIFLWRHRVRRRKFENTIVHICNRINATENIRGINYRFSKNGSDYSDINKQIAINSNAGIKPLYAIVIEFDDRYNALSSQQFNRYSSVDFVTVPLYAHLYDEKKCGTYPNWMTIPSKQFDEKFIIHHQ